MKHLVIASSLLLASAAFAKGGKEGGSGRPDVYTFRVLHIKADVTQDNAKKTLEAINPVLIKSKGFEKRNLFFDADQKVWIDEIKWKHIDAAKAGLKNLEGDPAWSNLNKIVDEKTSLTYQGERTLEFNGPK